MRESKDDIKTGDDKKFDSFVESIEEEIRNENWQMLWSKYGRTIGYGISTVIVAVGVYSMWQRQDASDREAISASYTVVQNMLMSGMTDEQTMSKIREISNVSKKNYAALAKFEYAALLRAKNDNRALPEYESLFKDSEIDNMMSELAYIFYVNACIDLMKTAELAFKIEEFIETLKTKHIGKTWDLFARETLAYCQMKNGNNTEAKKTLEELVKISGIPESMAGRAKMLMNSFGE
ncbi:MAG: tetratricopeptide repeat protein [Holosporales bacterium]|jgi:hypothetical protein|nr:tetratricopeptide repeat protein [Holosporales bacterium]